MVSGAYLVKSLRDLHNPRPFCPEENNEGLCNNWQDIEPGFCDAVASYEVYSFR